MGKTKTAVLEEVEKKEEKTSEELYREKKARQEAKKHEDEKVHISGIKGGQRVKVISMDESQSEGEANPEENTVEAEKKISPKVRGKKYLEAKKKLDNSKHQKLAEAVKLVKASSYSKFDGTMELHITLKKGGVNAQTSLPFSYGRIKKVEVADDSTIKKLASGKIDFDVLLATAEMMPKLVPFARLLGPKGLMPNPKNGTIIKNAKEAEKFSGNSIALKTEKTAPLVHTVIGKVSQKDSELEANAEAVFKALGGQKQIVRAFIKSTMSPSVKISI